MREDEDALLAAYVDGVTELTSDERRRIEERLARDAAARTEARATRDLLDRLRELPPESNEPDFAAMARAISDEVGPTVPRLRWRPMWRWIIPGAVLTVAGAVFALWLRAPQPSPATPPVATHDAVAPTAPIATHDSVPLWLDGAEIDVDLRAAELLGDDDALGADHGVDELLPTTDLAIVDELSPDAADRVEQWLARTKS